MRATLLAVALACFPLAGVGCGSSSASSEDPIPLDRYCDAVAHSVCDRFVPCCTSGGYAVTADDCMQAQTSKCNAMVADQQTKHRVYDPSSAGACVRGGDVVYDGCAVRGLDYWSTGTLTEACVRVWTGTAHPGEACTEDADCAPQADADVSCADDGKGGHACVVEHFVGAGERCDLSAGGALVGCEGGSYCGLGADGTSSICVAAASDGEACNPAVPGTCRDGLACDYTNRVCRAPGAVGAGCYGGVPCQRGLYCGNEGTCTAPISEGSACEIYERCTQGLACIRGTCSTLLPQGETCKWSGECQSGRCDLGPPTYETGTCVDAGGKTFTWPDGFDPSICQDLAPVHP